jgi:PST family polysaccharide transporter
MFVRVQILRREGLAVTGQFDAAWSVGMNLSTLLLATLQTYHLPALAKARSASQLVSHVMSMLNAVVPVAAVLIVGTAALKPSVLTLIYSPEFTPAARYLRWTLPGIYLKATAWVLAAPMLACAHSSVFLTAELAAWIVFSGGAVLLARWWAPAESAAIAFVVMYLVHLAVSVIYLRRHHEFRWDSRVGALWVAGLVVVVAATAANWSLDPKSLVSQLEYGALWTLGVAAIQVPFLWRGRTQCAE